MTNFPHPDEPGSDAVTSGDDPVTNNDHTVSESGVGDSPTDLGTADSTPPVFDDPTLTEPTTDAESAPGEPTLAEPTTDADPTPNEPTLTEVAAHSEPAPDDSQDDSSESDAVDEEPSVPSSPLDALDPGVSDDELLAAASSSHHDEADMVNPTPGAAGPDPTDDPVWGTPDHDDTSHVPPPRPPSPPGGYQPGPPVRRLYRSRHDRRLGGVSAGIAEFFRIDPTLVRLATLVSAFTGIGVLVYIAAWFIIPLRPEGFVDAPRSTPVANERTMTLAFGIAALALAFGIVTGSWAVLAIALIGGGVWLLSEHTAIAPGMSGAAAGPGVSHYQTPSGFEPAYGPAPAATQYAAEPSGPVPPPPTYAAASPVRERKPQRITWTVLSLLALLAAVGIAAATGDWWDVSATRFLGIGVVIIGVGVVAGQLRRGGARGLIPLGILAALALFPVSAVDGLLDEGVGEANYRPSSIAELETKYEHGIGQMTVDLSELDFDGRTESIDIDLGIGELIVIVSEEAGGKAILQATAGEVSHMLPQSDSVLFEEGVNIETGTVVLEGENGTLDLNITVGLGTAELRSDRN